jgi:hypothetical protein
MVYTVSLALILYVASAILDAFLGITTLNPNRSLFLRIAAVATVITIFVFLTKKGWTLKVLPLPFASLILSFATIVTGGFSDLVVVNIGIKIVAIILTVKPDLVEIEMLTEDEEKQQPQRNSNEDKKEPDQ